MSPYRAFAYNWASRILAAAVVTLLLASVALFFQVRDLQHQLSDGRRERNAFQADANNRLCALLLASPQVDGARYAQLCSRP